MFERGDIVECVDAGPSPERQLHGGWPSGLVLGALYTVAEMLPATDIDAIGVVLVEVRTPPTPCGYGECGFMHTRFRKVYRPDPDLLAKLLHEPAPVELVSA